MTPVETHTRGAPVNLVGEIEIRGAITSRAVPVETAPGVAAMGARVVTRDGQVVAEDLLAVLQAVRASALVLHLDSPGGLTCRSQAIALAIRALGIPTVAVVSRAWSSAPLLALAADFVVVAPGEWMPGKPRICIHAPWPGGYPPEAERAQALDFCHQLAARSGVSAAALFRETFESDAAAGKPAGTRIIAFPPEVACEVGLADYVGTADDARALAAALMAGVHPRTHRQAVLAAKSTTTPKECRS